MTATTAQILAGLAVTASYRYSQHRTAPSDVNSGPIRAEAGAQGMCAASAPSQDRAVFNGGGRPGSGRGECDVGECGAPSAPQTLVGAVPPDTAPTRLHGAHRG